MEKTIEERLSNYGYTHTASKISGKRMIIDKNGLPIADMDSEEASRFINNLDSVSFGESLDKIGVFWKPRDEEGELLGKFPCLQCGELARGGFCSLDCAAEGEYRLRSVR